VAEVAYRSGHLETTLLVRLRYDGERRRLGLRQFDLKAFVATPAHGVRCAELHQTAMVATEHLPLFH
jgi:hypothetical protein